MVNLRDFPLIVWVGSMMTPVLLLDFLFGMVLSLLRWSLFSLHSLMTNVWGSVLEELATERLG